jgi:hypothetical protein
MKEGLVFAAYLVVTILAAGANVFAAAVDFIRPQWLLDTMGKVGVAESWLPVLGILKAAGALGLLIGIAVPTVGIAAAAGLTLFFVGAIATHLRAHNYSLVMPAMFLIAAVGTLALGICVRG